MRKVFCIVFCLGCTLFFCSENSLGQIRTNFGPLWKRDTVIGDNVFKKHSNWLSGGVGTGKNSQYNGMQFAAGMDYNFHLHLEYFQFGLFVTGPNSTTFNNYEFHLAYGKRKENAKTNFSCFGGISYSAYFAPIGNGFDQNAAHGVGLYGNAQLIFKLTYDVGIGTGVFLDVNTLETVGGLKIDLYFSGAYRGTRESIN